MPRAPEPPSPRTGCTACQELIESFVDGELSALDRKRMDRHLELCGEGRAQAELARRIRDELRTLPRFEAPPSTFEVAPPRSKGMFLALAAALLLAAIGASIWLWRPPGQQTFSTAGSEGSGTGGSRSEAVTRAELEARYALALMSDLTRRQVFAVRDEVLVQRVLAPTTQALGRVLSPPPDAGSARARPASREADREQTGTSPGKPS